MTHADDNGMIMPPRLAPSHVAILPIYRNDDESGPVLSYCEEVASELRGRDYHGRPVEVVVDKRDMNAGEKGWEWIKKGIPVCVEIGPRDIAEGAVFVGRRDKSRRERRSERKEAFTAGITDLLDDIQANLFARALTLREENTRTIDDRDEFTAFFTPANKAKPEIHGGFAMAHWCEGDACEQKVNEDLSVTIRCIPLEREAAGTDRCIVCGEPSKGRVVFAKSY